MSLQSLILSYGRLWRWLAGLWICVSHHWISPLMSLELSVIWGAEAWWEELSPWAWPGRVDICVHLSSAFDCSLVLSCHARNNSFGPCCLVLGLAEILNWNCYTLRQNKPFLLQGMVFGLCSVMGKLLKGYFNAGFSYVSMHQNPMEGNCRGWLQNSCFNSWKWGLKEYVSKMFSGDFHASSWASECYS